MRRLPDLRLHFSYALDCCLERLRWFQPCHHRQPPCGTPVEPGFAAAHERFGAERKDDVECAAHVGTEEARRRHANDGDWHAFDVERTADRVRGAPKPSLPEVVADHGNGTVRAAAAPVVAIGKRPSEYGRHAERLEHGPARPDPIDKLGFAAGCEIETIVRPCERSLEELRPLVDLIPNRIRPGSLTVSGGFDELNELLWLLHRKRAQQETVDHGEDRRVRANAKRQRQDGHEGDDWGCPKRTNRETEIIHRSPLVRADYPLDARRERTVGRTGITSASRVACMTRKTGRVVQPDGDGCRMLPRFWRSPL